MTATFPKTTWRLILSNPQPGAINMAVDSAILAGVEREESPPTLRLYSWDPPCLSLGYSQPISDVATDRLEERGWDLVRRPTGGRAILHTDELTYSVIGPKNDPRLQGSLIDSDRNISRALFDMLSRLGLPVEVHQGKNPEAHHQPVCFENPSDFEITVNGKKIIGSAQSRKKISLLQHGSLPLTGDLTRITQVLSYPTPGERARAGAVLLNKAAVVDSILGRTVSWDQAADAFQESFSRILNLDLAQNDLTTFEKEEAKRLADEKYSHPDWIRGTHTLKPR